MVYRGVMRYIVTLCRSNYHCRTTSCKEMRAYVLRRSEFYSWSVGIYDCENLEKLSQLKIRLKSCKLQLFRLSAIVQNTSPLSHLFDKYVSLEYFIREKGIFRIQHGTFQVKIVVRQFDLNLFNRFSLALVLSDTVLIHNFYSLTKLRFLLHGNSCYARFTAYDQVPKNFIVLFKQKGYGSVGGQTPNSENIISGLIVLLS